MIVTIRPLDIVDYAAWLPLWQENNLGRVNDKITAQTWARLIAPDYPAMQGLGAFEKKSNKMLGFAHYVLHPTTGALNDAAYLQDVFVRPESRGQGIAKKLVQGVIKEGSKQRWSRLYWFAQQDNAAAQALYKKIAPPIDFTLHVLPL